jgi:hypothetical protein
MRAIPISAQSTVRRSTQPHRNHSAAAICILRKTRTAILFIVLFMQVVPEIIMPHAHPPKHLLHFMFCEKIVFAGLATGNFIGWRRLLTVPASTRNGSSNASQKQSKEREV